MYTTIYTFKQPLVETKAFTTADRRTAKAKWIEIEKQRQQFNSEY